MTQRFSIQRILSLVLVLQALSVPAQAAEAPQDAAASGRAAAEASGPGLLELLEFIGEFTTEDGEWVDPATLEADSELADAPRRGTAQAGNGDDDSAAGNCGIPPCE